MVYNVHVHIGQEIYTQTHTHTHTHTHTSQAHRQAQIHTRRLNSGSSLSIWDIEIVHLGRESVHLGHEKNCPFGTWKINKMYPTAEFGRLVVYLGHGFLHSFPKLAAYFCKIKNQGRFHEIWGIIICDIALCTLSFPELTAVFFLNKGV